MIRKQIKTTTIKNTQKNPTTTPRQWKICVWCSRDKRAKGPKGHTSDGVFERWKEDSVGLGKGERRLVIVLKWTPIESGSPWKKLDCTPSAMENCKQHIIRLLFITLEEISLCERIFYLWIWIHVGDTYLFPSINTQYYQNACNFYCNVACQDNRIQLKPFNIIFYFSYIIFAQIHFKFFTVRHFK